MKKKDSNILLMVVTSRWRYSFVMVSAIRISYAFFGCTSHQTLVHITAVQVGLVCYTHRLKSQFGT